MTFLELLGFLDWPENQKNGQRSRCMGDQGSDIMDWSWKKGKGRGREKIVRSITRAGTFLKVNIPHILINLCYAQSCCNHRAFGKYVNL